MASGPAPAGMTATVQIDPREVALPRSRQTRRSVATERQHLGIECRANGTTDAAPARGAPGIELASVSRRRRYGYGTGTQRHALDLVTEVAKYTRSDTELIATVAYMVNSGGGAPLRQTSRARASTLDAPTDDVAA